MNTLRFNNKMPNAKPAWSSIFIPFALGYFVSYLLRTVNAVISPALSSDLHLAASDLGLLTSTYFFAFALAQLPVGVALDRFGPGRTCGSLLLFAVVGCAGFAMAEDMAGLAISRALIGLGVSSTLMSAFKGFSLWVEREKHASITGRIMAVGAVGAVMASIPVGWAMHVIGWRGVFWCVAGLSLVASLSILRFVPTPKAQTGSHLTLRESFASLGEVFRTAHFWRYAGQSALVTGGFMAIQGLWAAPWMMKVERLSITQTASLLLLLNVGMLAGQLSIGALGNKLAARGVRQLDWLRNGILISVLAQVLIVTSAAPGWLVWTILGFSNAANAQQYGALARHFPVAMSGRITAALNLMAFVGAFAIQWGFGAALDVLQRCQMDLPTAFRWCFGAVLVLQAVSCLPLWRESKKL